MTIVSAIAEGTSASHMRPVDDRPGERGRPGRHLAEHGDSGLVALVSTTTTVAPTSTTSAHGTTGSNRLPTSSTATEATEMSSDHTLSVPRPLDQPDDLVDELAARVDAYPEHLRDLR